jgi:hypothetical protein
MKRLLLALGFALWALPAHAQAPCIGVGGVNTVPQVGIVCQQDSLVPTYHAISQGLVPGTAPTDIGCINGAANTVIRLKKVRISGTAGTAINVNVFQLKHASLDTGGTLATGTAAPVPYAADSNFAAAKATLSAWTANPTINDALPGLLNAGTVFLPVTSTATGSNGVLFYWDEGGYAFAPPTLRTAAQQLCINLNGATAPSSGLMNIEWVWTELSQ